MAAREAEHGASLWTVTKQGRLIEYALRVGNRGVEAHIRRDGHVRVVHEFDELDQAVAHGSSLLHDLSANGWQVA